MLAEDTPLNVIRPLPAKDWIAKFSALLGKNHPAKADAIIIASPYVCDFLLMAQFFLQDDKHQFPCGYVSASYVDWQCGQVFIPGMIMVSGIPLPQPGHATVAIIDGPVDAQETGCCWMFADCCFPGIKRSERMSHFFMLNSDSDRTPLVFNTCRF